MVNQKSCYILRMSGLHPNTEGSNRLKPFFYHVITHLLEGKCDGNYMLDMISRSTVKRIDFIRVVS